MPRERTRAQHLERLILLGLTLSLPTLSLVPLGGLYLWERGWLLHWALGTLMAVGAFALAERLLGTRPAELAPDGPPTNDETPYRAGSPAARAWSDVQSFARSIEPAKIDDMQAVMDLGVATITRVARRMHPERHDAVWNFTIPEALSISEAVSRRFSCFVLENIPFSDRLTVAQLRSAYRWRGAIGAAEHAYNLWRLLRLANPATAVTNEARERLSRAAFGWGREQLIGRLSRAYIEEVGRTAIALYDGGDAREGGLADPGNPGESSGSAGASPAAATSVVEPNEGGSVLRVRSPEGRRSKLKFLNKGN